MKKGILILFVFCSFVAHAQKGVLELKAGTSIPMFAYASKQLNWGCFTEPGLTVSAEANALIWKQFGVNLLAGMQLHSVDVAVLGWETVQADPFLDSIYTRSDPYRIFHLAIGPDYSVLVGDRLTFGLKAFAGVFFSQSPYQLYKPVYNEPGPSFYEVTPSKDISYGWGTGLDVKYKLSNCYEIVLGGDYMQSAASFTFKTKTGYRTDDRWICFINVSAGLVLHLL
jgi:hypothetical protein